MVHRGIAYGLVAPLFEQAKVCANHLAQYGIAQYKGSVTSTKLKVTGIDVFSAGDFSDGPDTEDILMLDKQAGRYKRIILRQGRIVGSVLYGDTNDGSWYFQLMKDGQDVSEMREQLLMGSSFASSHLGDGGHTGENRAAAMPDTAEVCGCNGVCKGAIVKSIKENGLFTIDESRLKALDAAQLKALQDSNFLAPCYLILTSLYQLKHMIRQRNRKGREQIVNFRVLFKTDEVKPADAGAA